LRERLNPFTVERSIPGIEQGFLKGFRMSGVVVDQKEATYIRHLLVISKALCGGEKIMTVQKCTYHLERYTIGSRIFDVE
jgi:hypothetical protein